jgi:hypothetical protein
VKNRFQNLPLGGLGHRPIVVMDLRQSRTSTRDIRTLYDYDDEEDEESQARRLSFSVQEEMFEGYDDDDEAAEAQVGGDAGGNVSDALTYMSQCADGHWQCNLCLSKGIPRTFQTLSNARSHTTSQKHIKAIAKQMMPPPRPPSPAVAAVGTSYAPTGMEWDSTAWTDELWESVGWNLGVVCHR